MTNTLLGRSLFVIGLHKYDRMILLRYRKNFPKNSNKHTTSPHYGFKAFEGLTVLRRASSKVYS